MTPTLHPPPPSLGKGPHFAAPPACCPVIQGVLLRNSGWYEVNLLYMVMMVLNQSLWSLTSMWNPSLLPTTAFESITSFFTPFPLQIKRGCWYVGRIRNACLTHHYTNFPSFKKYKYLYLNWQICHRLKGKVSMLPWHAIPFLKGLGMLNANPCQKMSKWVTPLMVVMQLAKEHATQ